MSMMGGQVAVGGFGSALYYWLAGRQGSADPLDAHAFACIIAIRCADGTGPLSVRLGLTPEQLGRLFKKYFPGAWVGDLDALCEGPMPRHDAVLDEEIADLRDLLLGCRSHGAEEEEWLAAVIARCCLGANHLWQDLGLSSRADLSTLIERHFQPLKARNSGDMKWKKFLYKQLCEQEEVVTCKSPNCQVCCDFDLCFGPEI